ncbi:hypothetical protein ACGFZH_37090 [Streptomyces zaomyceticus]
MHRTADGDGGKQQARSHGLGEEDRGLGGGGGPQDPQAAGWTW